MKPKTWIHCPCFCRMCSTHCHVLLCGAEHFSPFLCLAVACTVVSTCSSEVRNYQTPLGDDCVLLHIVHVPAMPAIDVMCGVARVFRANGRSARAFCTQTVHSGESVRSARNFLEARRPSTRMWLPTRMNGLRVLFCQSRKSSADRLPESEPRQPMDGLRAPC
jgi:hypothetical protein